MNLKYKILAVLAAGIALTACGGSIFIPFLFGSPMLL